MAFTGAAREKCVSALEAAGGNVDMAFEFVMTGIPQRRPGGGGAPRSTGNFIQDFLNTPNLQPLIAQMKTNPQFLQAFLA